jgi:hypothetical protein
MAPAQGTAHGAAIAGGAKSAARGRHEALGIEVGMWGIEHVIAAE